MDAEYCQNCHEPLSVRREADPHCCICAECEHDPREEIVIDCTPTPEQLRDDPAHLHF